MVSLLRGEMLSNVVERFRLHVDCVDRSARGDGVDEATCEISGAGSEICDRHARPEIEGLEYFCRFLVCIPLRPVQPVEIFCDIREWMGMPVFPVAAGRQQEQTDKGDED